MTPSIYDMRDAEVDAARKIRNRQIVEAAAGVACAVAGALVALCVMI